ncbi:MAG: TIGR00282 family metallophosphoesterase [Deltaproteobacteria bacterium]|nr:TIGR00282 family metallophosphoesterase [Deltaproteobacteria bacterium]
MTVETPPPHGGVFVDGRETDNRLTEQTKILFIGDIIGRPGRIAARELLPRIVGAHSPDCVIANGENAAGGFGITTDIARELHKLQIDVITSGNHVWDKKEIYDYLRDSRTLIRPANYPPGAPGRGETVFECASGAKVGVLNLIGRVFMDNLDCPFRAGREAVARLRETTPIILVDMHAEASSEKAALGHFLDGTVSAVIGTHTHVQTSDERLLANGAAFITDAGMTGATDSIIGMRKDEIITRFLTQLPVKFDVATKDVELQGVVVTVNNRDGRAVRIERIKQRVGE